MSVILPAILAFAPCALKAQTPNPEEISSRDVAPTFKLQSERNVVLVRVVVRNSKGVAVDTLGKEDFQLFDHGKLQIISHFSIEKPAVKTPGAPAQKPAEKTAAAEPEATDETRMPDSSAQRFLALYFDDANTTFDSLVRARNAADHFLKTSVRPGDRVAIYTSSGLKQLDFTDDLAQVHQALFALRPRPIVGESTSCVAMPPYEAYLIVTQQDPVALEVATEEIGNCNPPSVTDPNELAVWAEEQYSILLTEASRSLAMSEVQATAALRQIEDIVRRMTSVPGQRSVVIVSAGFLTETLHGELEHIADRALRANVVVNAIDARGLYTDSSLTDSSKLYMAYTYNPAIAGEKNQMLLQSQKRQTDGMETLALNTGGVFFNNSNDLEGGFRLADGLPGAYYLLAFSPQNLKLDGVFHPLQVKLASPKGLTVQARRGYYAPKKPDDPTVREKEEIQEAVFSQDETHELPIDVHTQFFMKTESDARITVLTNIDLRPLHFRKVEDRNLDDLTFVTVVFDRDGHLVNGQQKSLQLRLRDSSLDRYQQTGITLRALFDVKPGTYLVRAVVRDSQSGQISGLNRTVEIPY